MVGAIEPRLRRLENPEGESTRTGVRAERSPIPAKGDRGLDLGRIYLYSFPETCLKFGHDWTFNDPDGLG